MNQPLPASFRSVYRLFLRTTSASVLHHKPATTNLRRIWRPSFEAAAHRLRRQQQNPGLALGNEGQWFADWNKRVDNTLALLYTSCRSRGLAHQVTRNLSLLLSAEYKRLHKRQLRTWKPHLPPDSPEYRPRVPTKKEQITAERQRYDEKAWSSLEEVVRMAEGRDELVLGKMAVKRRAS